MLKEILKHKCYEIFSEDHNAAQKYNTEHVKTNVYKTVLGHA